jgi:hypothetical protein
MMIEESSMTVNKKKHDQVANTQHPHPLSRERVSHSRPLNTLFQRQSVQPLIVTLSTTHLLTVVIPRVARIRSSDKIKSLLV